MNDVIAQAATLDPTWIIGGLSSAFVLFAAWVGKFLKLVWGDIKVIWSEFKALQTDQIHTFELAIGKQDASTQAIKDNTAEILSETIKIKKIVEDTKFSMDAFLEKNAIQ